MANAPLLYNGDASDTTAITAALGTKDPADIFIIPNAGGQGVAIFEQGS